MSFFFFQAEDGIRYLVRSRGLGDVYKRQARRIALARQVESKVGDLAGKHRVAAPGCDDQSMHCLLYTSDAADERSSVDLGGRRIIKKTNIEPVQMAHHAFNTEHQ